jgi:hypothetical protein
MTMDQSDRRRPQLSPSQQRLQRPPDFTGSRLDSFSDVALRHGLPGLVLGVLCLVPPGMRELLGQGLAAAGERPFLYLGWAVLILAALNFYAWYIDRRWSPDRMGWVLYLGALSVWEEWVFRLALPYYLQHVFQASGEDVLQTSGGGLAAAVVVCNLLFGLAHFFTLRWRWYWCVAAFLGGMALSRQFAQHFDLLLVIGIHWVATFLNTPRLPGQRRARDARPDA